MTIIGSLYLHPCERERLYQCQVSRADILVQLGSTERCQGVLGHRRAISRQHCHTSHCRMMNGHMHVPHICPHTRAKIRTYSPAWVNQDLAFHHRITQRRTDIHTVALHYSEPGVGRKGNKVVFISCSLGVF